MGEPPTRTREVEIQGAAVAGTQGMGVSTPKAAAVAEATTGFARDRHMPKVGMFTKGLLSRMFATGGPPPRTRFTGSTLRGAGVTPMLQLSMAPVTSGLGTDGRVPEVWGPRYPPNWGEATRPGHRYVADPTSADSTSEGKRAMPSYLSPGVYIEEVPAATRPIEGVGTAVAGFVGFAAQGPVNEPVLVTNWTQFVETFGDMVENYALGKAVYGFFNNGGGRAYIVRIPTDARASSAPAAEIASAADAKASAVSVRALKANAEKVTVDVKKAKGKDADEYTITVNADGKTETFTGGLGAGPTNVVTQVNTRSKAVRIQPVAESLADAGLKEGTVTLASSANLPAVKVESAAVVGDSSKRTGFTAFETIEDITMIAAPDVVTAHAMGHIDLDAVKAVQAGMLAHCELMGNRMAILDTPSGMNAQQVSDWRSTTTGFDSKFGVMYWPWVDVLDPTVGRNVAFPPSGHIAGLWSRNDDTRGVFKAPANEVLLGAVGVGYLASRGEMDLLNPQGVNVIKAFPGRGIRVWGARTLSSDAEWRYVNVRRYFNYLEESILQGTQWAVFEPNDANLWGRIRRTISAFLVNEWRSGALFGSSPQEAFFVKCDGENNTSESIDAGMVVVEVGVAPVKPAEFVIFRLSQFSGGTSIAE